MFLFITNHTHNIMIDRSVPLNKTHYFRSISDLCKALGVTKPTHPLIALVHHDKIMSENDLKYMVHDFYMVSYKSNLNAKLKYGQGYYDFDEGGLIFVAPGQALSVVDENDVCQGISLFFHPDLLLGSPMGKSFKKYGFFSYNISEALHLSEKEKEKVMRLFDDIEQELLFPIDEISQDLIISYIEVLLNYSNRYYKRQFITRKVLNNSLIEKFEHYLSEYFATQQSLHNGLPSVKYFSDKLNVSDNYLRDLLRNTTGLSPQQHIHLKLIEVAKEKLTTTNLTAAEIAYELGFEHPQSFNKLFKSKTSMSPVTFRESFN